jgi:hypothetical protein
VLLRLLGDRGGLTDRLSKALAVQEYRPDVDRLGGLVHQYAQVA